MKKAKWLSGGLFILLILICSFLGGCFSKPGHVNSNNDANPPFVGIGAGEYVADQVLVRFKPGADIDQILKPINGRIIKYNQKLNFYQISFVKTNKLNVLGAARILRDSNQVYLVEPNYIYKAYGAPPNDPNYSKQWGLDKINAPAGWDSSTGSSEIRIAIVDTGIDNMHPDLSGKVLSGYNAITGSVVLPGDDNGHGTHCAGIAAALSNNGIGVAGVAWQCNLMAVKVLNSGGSGEVDDIVDGIVWAADHNANVISMSLGGDGYSRLFQNAVDYALSKNVVIVAAAGNDSRRTDNNFPSCFPGVIAVGATNPSDGKANFSTESNSLFIAAPGEQIYSTLPNGQYGYLSGTSMATPFVSGAVALIKSKFGAGIPVSQVFSQLKKTATDIGASGWDQQTGWGRLNLQPALDSLQPDEFGKLIVTVTAGGQPVPNAQILLTNTGTGKVIYNIVTGTNALSGTAQPVSTGQACFWSLPAGNYSITAKTLDYEATAIYMVSGGGVTNETLALPIPSPIIYTDFNETAENSPSQVRAKGTWGKTNVISHSASYSWTDSPGGNYGYDADMSLTTVPIDFTGSLAPKLHFWQRYNTESGYDICRVEVSTNYGDTWESLGSWSGTQSTWTEKTINLFNYKTQTHLLIRFRFISDEDINGDGWYIDDISINEPPAPIDYTTFHETAENSPSQVTADGAWAKFTTNPYSAPNCWRGNFSGTNTNHEVSLITVPVNMTGSIAPRLHFWQRFDAPSTYLRVEVSSNYGNTWSQLCAQTGTQSTWGEKIINLGDYKTQTALMIRFYYFDDGSSTNGWYIDDISIVEPPAPISYTTFNETAENSPSQVIADGTWVKFTTNPYSTPNCWKGSFSGNYTDLSMSLITVPINMIGSVAPRLHFWQRFDASTNLKVEASTDYGNTWSQIDFFGAGIKSTWGEESISLGGYKSQTHLMIRFSYYDLGSSSNGWYIDNISIVEPPAPISYTTFNETAENFPSQVTVDGTWAKVTTNPRSAPNCWKGSFSGSYTGNVMSLVTVPVNMTGSNAPRLHFWQRYNIQYIGVQVAVSTDYGNSWSSLGFTWSGTQSTWTETIISLENYKTQTHLMIRFCFNDTRPTSDDWYIDDISIDEYPVPISYTTFNETAENSPSQVTTEGTWGKTGLYYHSAPNSWTDSPGGNYTNNTNMSLSMVPIDLTGSTAPKLHFWQRYSTDNNNDWCFIELSTDYGTTWNIIGSGWLGTQTSWMEKIVDLSSYQNQTHLMIRFHFSSNGSITSDGWYIDDISITAN